jgi:hypothetical protein
MRNDWLQIFDPCGDRAFSGICFREINPEAADMQIGFWRGSNPTL